MNALPAPPSAPVVAIAVWLACAAAEAQDIPGSYARADSKGLRVAVEKAPDNAGLKLRLALSLTVEAQKDRKISVEEIAAIQKGVLEADAEALVPLRGLVREAYYGRKWDEAIGYGERLLKLDPGDVDAATLVVKAMIRVGREDDAVAAMLNWFRTGYMPPSGATQGILSAVILNQKVKQGLDTGFPKLVAENPRQILVRLAFASFLSEVGKGEDAWREFHEAEKDGLCDATNGGRHPLAQMLAKKWEEPAFPGAFAGNDLEEMTRKADEHPEHAGLRIRVARRTELPVTARRTAESTEKVTSPEDLARLEKAVSLYLKAYEINPDCWPPLLRAGELEIERGRYPEAAEVLKTAAGKFADNVPLFMSLAEARFRGGDTKGAADAFLGYARAVEPGRKTRAFWESLAAGDPAKLDPFAAALKADAAARPKNARLRSHLALLRLIQGDSAGAKEAALEAERLGLVGLRGYPHATMLEVFGIQIAETRRESN
jgi:thioredoxin-like negative regulator of GroEL